MDEQATGKWRWRLPLLSGPIALCETVEDAVFKIDIGSTLVGVW